MSASKSSTADRRPVTPSDETALPLTPHFIGGQPHEGTSGRFGDVYNPATGRLARRVSLANAADVHEAVAAAAAAFPAWAAAPPLRRARVLNRFRELVERNLTSLAAIITSEHGKVASDAAGEVQRGNEVVEFATGIPQLLKGEFTEEVGTGVDSYSIRQPLGVVAGITPFNFPAMVPMWMFPVALACGNTFVLKPSEKDPTTSLELAKLLKEAGLPDGVFNVVHGDKEAVDALIADPRIEAISFVGLDADRRVHLLARHRHRQAGPGAGRREEPHGGHARRRPRSGDRRAGRCGLRLGRRALHGDLGGGGGRRRASPTSSCRAITTRLATLKVAPGDEPGAEMGPLVTGAHLERVRGYIDLGVEEGAELVVDGRAGAAVPDGFFIGATLFDRVTPSMRIYREEIFGPVLSVVRVPDFEAALTLVNDHEFGNGTAIFTRDGDAARVFSSRVKAGMVGVNVPIPVPMAFHSFGGWKRSLFGDHYVHGPEGVRFYTRLKTITSRWPTGIRKGAEFKMPVLG